MLITRDKLELCIPYASDRNISKFLSPLNEAMIEFGIYEPLHIAAFLAQVTHESGSLKYVEEIASGSNYEFREDLGNLEFEACQVAHRHGTTSGKFYKGHGLMQITGYYNHRACGKALGLDLVENPRLLCEPSGAARCAAWFWFDHHLNTFIDADNFNKTTRIINGGFNGKQDRLNNFNRCRGVLCK